MSNDVLEKLNIVIPELKNADTKYAKLSTRFQYVYLVFIPVYSILFGIDLYEDFRLTSMFSGICFILSFVLFFLLFRKYSKEYNSVDYALPTLMMLKKAAYRYYPMRKEIWLAIAAIILIDIALSLNGPLGGDIIMQQIIFFGMAAMSAGIGIVVWWYKYKSLRDVIMKLIREIEN